MGKRRSGRSTTAVKQDGEITRGTQVWHRLVNGGAEALVEHLSKRQELTSEPAKLFLRGLATTRQLTAMLTIGTIYRSHHHWHSQRPSPASINFEGAIRAHDSVGELFDPDMAQNDAQKDKRSNIEEAIKQADKRYHRLQLCLHKLRAGWNGKVADLIYHLCVDNQPIGDLQVEAIMPTIDIVAQEFSGRGPGRPRKSTLAIGRKDHRPTAKQRGPSARKVAFMSTVAVLLQPDVGAAQLPEALQQRLDDAYRQFHELQKRGETEFHREKFRGEKSRLLK